MDARPLLLIVDDDVRSATLLGNLLRADGYDTEALRDGSAALERLAQVPIPDALITDFHLPGADGLVLGQRARASRAGIPIFVVTGDPHAVASAPTALVATVEIMAKPLDYADLVRRLQRVIAKASATA